MGQFRAGEVSRIRGRIKAAGHPWTRPRGAILGVLVAARVPLTIEELYHRLGRRAGRSPINLSSVYRTVNLLHGLGVVQRVQLGDRPLRYELAEDYRAHHHHLVCEACGRIEDVRRCPIKDADLGLAVRSHTLELSGLCRACAPREIRHRVSL